MFRLPTCPHCGTVYRYGDVTRERKKKNHTCYHCERPFSVRHLPGMLIPSGIGIALCILTNVLLLDRMKVLNLILLFVITLLYIGLIILASPFFTRFKSGDETKRRK